MKGQIWLRNMVWILKLCLSNKLSDDADAVGQ